MMFVIYSADKNQDLQTDVFLTGYTLGNLDEAWFLDIRINLFYRNLEWLQL